MKKTELLEIKASLEIIAEQAGLKNRVHKLLPEKIKEIEAREAKNDNSKKD